LSNLAPDGNLKEKAVKLITELNGQIPPKIEQFLELPARKRQCGVESGR